VPYASSIWSLLPPRLAEAELAIAKATRTGMIDDLIHFIPTLYTNREERFLVFVKQSNGKRRRSMTAESLSRAFAQHSIPLIMTCPAIKNPIRVSRLAFGR
jgi:hypothetical protein